MKKLIFAALALYVVSGPAQAVDCGRSFYAEIASRARAIEADSKRCAPQVKLGKRADPRKLCAACGPLAWRLVYIERYLTAKKACLTDRRSRAVLAKLRSQRRNLYAVKEICGY